MNRRSFIAACCGGAVAPFVKVKAEPLDLRRYARKFAHGRQDLIKDRQPEAFVWGTTNLQTVTWSGYGGLVPKGPIKAIPCRVCGDMIEPVVSWQ